MISFFYTPTTADFRKLRFSHGEHLKLLIMSSIDKASNYSLYQFQAFYIKYNFF